MFRSPNVKPSSPPEISRLLAVPLTAPKKRLALLFNVAVPAPMLIVVVPAISRPEPSIWVRAGLVIAGPTSSPLNVKLPVQVVTSRQSWVTTLHSVICVTAYQVALQPVDHVATPRQFWS